MYTKDMPAFAGNPSDGVHLSGCTQPGLKMADGCRPIDVVKGFTSGYVDAPLQGTQSQESCRGLAMKDSDKYIGWGLRNNDHPVDSLKNTCFLYTKEMPPFAGTPNDGVHLSGCTKPGVRMVNGCLS
jgi:hypothetical protein